MRYFASFLLVMILSAPFLSADIHQSIEIPSYELDHTENIFRWNKIIEPGFPKVPKYNVRILIPYGEKVENVLVTYHSEAKQNINDRFEIAKQQQPISSNQIFNNSAELKFDTEKFFPENDFSYYGTQRMKGYDIAVISLYPIKYKEATGEIFQYTNCDLTIKTSPVKNTKKQSYMLITNDKVQSEIRKMVENPSTIEGYVKEYSYSSRSIVSEDDPYSMIIITDEEHSSYLEEYAEWKESQDLSAKVFYTMSIYENYEGMDFPTQIRNFIIDAYSTYSSTDTPLEYVILAGDDEIIPIRGCYGEVGSYTDYLIPTDGYYAQLDGDWDANENEIYGEFGDDVDMYPEIAVGRFPADCPEDFENIIAKTKHYVEDDTYSDEICYMFGENLNNNPLTWGGDYKDEIIPKVPDEFHIYTLYERDGTYSAGNVFNAINSGLGAINHMGHANENMVFGQTRGSALNMTNSDFGWAYSQGCYPAAFDEATSGASESVSENLVQVSGGLFAFIGNTRYGWYAPGSTDGASQFFDRAYFDAIFHETDTNLHKLGNALNYSKVELIDEALSSTVMRWVNYEMILFGDPSITVKTPTGLFPMLKPGEVTISDEDGDSDGMINPGEFVKVYIEIINEEDWADAFDVTASISFEDENVDLINSEVTYGNINSGDSEVLNSQYFSFNVPEDIGYSAYDFQITINATTLIGATFEKTYNLSFQVSLNQQEWPWMCSTAIKSAPFVTDFDLDGNLDVIFTDSFGNPVVLDEMTNQIDLSFDNFSENIWKSTAMANIDGIDGKEIIIASRSGRVYALNHLGELVFDVNMGISQLLTPVIADVDGDGADEIITVGIDKNLHVMKIDGTELEGFPIEVPDMVVSEIAAGDLDGNTTYEIVVGTNTGEIYAYDYNAEILNGFPVDLSSQIVAAPIILPDGKIVTGTNSQNLVILSNTGEILLDKALGAKINHSVIAANFDSDTELEIAFSTTNRNIYLLNLDGTELENWPISIDKQTNNPLLAADINNDGNADVILLTSNSDLYAWNNDATLMPFAPVPVNLSSNAPAMITDLDGDNDFEVISANTFGVDILDIKLPAGNYVPWTEFRGNSKRTGFFSDNTTLSATPELALAKEVLLYQNYPNPFSPGKGRASSTIIKYNLASKTNVDISIFNLKGQKISNLVNEVQDKGIKSVTWNGIDKNGKELPSGVYLYRLKTQNSVLHNKLLLIK